MTRGLDDFCQAGILHRLDGEPEGQGRWSLRSLPDKVVELEVVESVSYHTVRRTLKRTNLSLA